MDALLPQITSVISERFGYYHVGIFLNNESDQTAVLAAANSEGGKQMLARGHRLKSASRVRGTCRRHRCSAYRRSVVKIVLFQIIRSTRDLSEMALAVPGESIVGVLDVQSKTDRCIPSGRCWSPSLLADEVSLAIEQYPFARKHPAGPLPSRGLVSPNICVKHGTACHARNTWWVIVITVSGSSPLD